MNALTALMVAREAGASRGMTPARFRDVVLTIASRVGFPAGRIILGGDHLGPNPWKHLPAEAAMAKAEEIVAAYAAAGFTKLHLDASMGCAGGEPAALSDAVVAGRAMRLAVGAEVATAAATVKPVYVIGTEVPTPDWHRGAGPGWCDRHAGAPAPDDAGSGARDLRRARDGFQRGGAGGVGARACHRGAARRRVRP